MALIVLDAGGETPFNINMADEAPLKHVIDVARHGGTEILSEPVPPPKTGGNFALDENVINGMDTSRLTLSKMQSSPYTREKRYMSSRWRRRLLWTCEVVIGFSLLCI